jgi:ActR/RegA family two-component response regulator
MSKPNTEGSVVTQEELVKSVNDLTAMLNADAPVKDGDATATLEKSLEAGLVGTNGGLTPEVAAPELDPTLTTQAAEVDGGLESGAGESVAKSEVEGMELRAEMGKDTVGAESDPEFMKSLASAFAEQEVIQEIAQTNEFAKSLVVSTIEGLSIMDGEMKKSLAAMEERSNSRLDARINVLAKGLIAIANAVGAIQKEVLAVSNAPARPKVKSATALEKSFGAENTTPALSKASVMPVLEKLQAEGKINAFQVVRYESAGEMDAALAAMVQSELGK